jgi:hypothetical protein
MRKLIFAEIAFLLVMVQILADAQISPGSKSREATPEPIYAVSIHRELLRNVDTGYYNLGASCFNSSYSGHVDLQCRDDGGEAHDFLEHWVVTLIDPVEGMPKNVSSPPAGMQKKYTVITSPFTGDALAYIEAKGIEIIYPDKHGKPKHATLKLGDKIYVSHEIVK